MTITMVTPTSAVEIVRHMRSGGRCLVQVKPHGRVCFTYPRDVERVRQDANGVWWFGVQLFAFQWFQFPAQGLIWTLCGCDRSDRTMTQTVMYRARYKGTTPGIEKVLVDKISPSSVWINGYRVAKVSDGQKFFEQFEAARGWLLNYWHTEKEDAHALFVKYNNRILETSAIQEADLQFSTSRW